MADTDAYAKVARLLKADKEQLLGKVDGLVRQVGTMASETEGLRDALKPQDGGTPPAAGTPVKRGL